MKKLLLTFLLTVVSVSMKAFWVDGIYYQVIDRENRKVMVAMETVWNEDFTTYNYVYYKGALNIPPTISFEGETYTVVRISVLSNCTELTSVTLPNTIEEIDQIAFQNCKSLTHINLPPSLKKIGMMAFAHSGLREISIPSSVESIGAWSFDCDSLEKVVIQDLAAWCNIEVTGYKSGIFSSKKPLHFYVGDESEPLTDLVIPSKVTTIRPCVFYDFSPLTSVTFHEKVDSIGQEAFRGCTGLQRVNISDLKAWCNIRFGETRIVNGTVVYVTNPLYYAGHLYMNGDELAELNIPEGTECIGQGAFTNCKSVTEVNLPSTMRKVSHFAFQGCTSIKTVNTPSLRSYCDIEFTTRESNPLTLNSDWTQLMENGNATTPTLAIPDGVKEIKPYAFCGNLTHSQVDIPASVKKIGTYAFYGNWYLNRLNIMGHLEEMGDNAFGNCTWLSASSGGSIHVHDPSPAPISEKAFYNTYGSIPGRPYASDYIYGSPLHVPVGTKTKYEQTAGWKQFKTIIEDIEAVTLKGDVNGDGVVDVADIASVITVMASAPQPGEASSADVNGDGTVDVADIATVITIMAEK